MKYVLWGIIGVAAVVIGAVMLSIYVPRWTAGPMGLTEEIQITNEGAYRVQGYELFYKRQAEVGAIDVKLTGYSGVLTVRRATECRGLQARRADLVAAYNAAALSMRTTGQWRAANLPQQLTQGNLRTCEAGG